MDLGVLNFIENEFASALKILDDFDHQSLEYIVNKNATYKLSYSEAINLVLNMKFNEKNDLFGREKDESFKSSISTINQTFDSVELYPTLEEKAANLLYLIVKNHSFIDGNKRIAACVFLYYLYKNNYFEDSNTISNKTLVTLTVMIAISDPKEKEVIIKLITNIM